MLFVSILVGHLFWKWDKWSRLLQAIPIISQTRFLEKKGELQEMSKGGTLFNMRAKFTPVYFFLFNDLLIIAAKKGWGRDDWYSAPIIDKHKRGWDMSTFATFLHILGHTSRMVHNFGLVWNNWNYQMDWLNFVGLHVPGGWILMPLVILFSCSATIRSKFWWFMTKWR